MFKSEATVLAAVSEERGRGATAFWIADPGGQGLTSEQFAERIRAARGRRPCGSWSSRSGLRMGGLPPPALAADLRLSLGAMTLPHELAALVLAEQIYRASTILQGHPYHLGTLKAPRGRPGHSQYSGFGGGTAWIRRTTRAEERSGRACC